ncbi:MAG: hypothetical protein ACRECD_05730 [Burkholderiaceae bacterium]
MKNETYSTHSSPATQFEGPALFSTTPDWRCGFRLSALDLNPDLRHAGRDGARDEGESDATHWIMQDSLLSRMVLSLQSDAQTLGHWQALDDGAVPACTSVDVIRQLGFENTPEPTGALDQVRFMVRSTLACLAHSKNSHWQTATLMHSLRFRPA